MEALSNQNRKSDEGLINLICMNSVQESHKTLDDFIKALSRKFVQ